MNFFNYWSKYIFKFYFYILQHLLTRIHTYVDVLSFSWQFDATGSSLWDFDSRLLVTYSHLVASVHWNMVKQEMQAPSAGSP